jgi:hypothetical protein
MPEPSREVKWVEAYDGSPQGLAHLLERWRGYGRGGPTDSAKVHAYYLRDVGYFLEATWTATDA